MTLYKDIKFVFFTALAPKFEIAILQKRSRQQWSPFYCAKKKLTQ